MSRGSASAASAGLQKAAHAKILQSFEALYDNSKACEPIGGGGASSALASAEAGEEVFDEHITFRSPFLQVTGLQNYKLQFAALHSTFARVSLEVMSVTAGQSKPWPPAALSPGLFAKNVIVLTPMIQEEILLIDAVCTYEVNKWVKFNIRQLSRLVVNKEGKIEAHEDIWSWADMIAAVPLLGRVYRAAQPLVGRVFSHGVNTYYAWRAGVPLRTSALGSSTVHAAYNPLESQRLAASLLKDPTAATADKKRTGQEHKTKASE